MKKQTQTQLLAKRLREEFNRARLPKWYSLAEWVLRQLDGAEKRGVERGVILHRLAKHRPQVVLDSKPVKGGRGMRVKWRVK